MSKNFLILVVFVLNTIAAKASIMPGQGGEVNCIKDNIRFQAIIDLHITDAPTMWGLRLVDSNGNINNGYPLLSKLINESDRCRNISLFENKLKITFVCAGELFMLTNIYGQVQISSGAENVLTEVLMKDSGWICKNTN